MPRENSQIVKTVKKVMPAVVSIGVSKKLEQIKREISQFYPSAMGDVGLQIPPNKIDAHGMVQIGGGSGFIVDKNGTILTNKHVIAEPRATYTAIISTGEKYPAEILARDPIDDIAILKIKPKQPLPITTLGNSDGIELGATVLAFGNALGTFRNTVSTGIISGLSRAIEAAPNPFIAPQEMRGLIQTDAAINPGNSGGPLTDVFGAVIGINTAVVAGAQNIGFAIPVKAAERDLTDLKRHGSIKRPLLGLRYLTINTDVKEKLKLPVDFGALVMREHPLDIALAPGGPADRAGIQEGDLILRWNGEKITETKTIHDYLEEAAVGDTVTLAIARRGRRLEKKVTLTERK
jgi:serine protease Do